MSEPVHQRHERDANHLTVRVAVLTLSDTRTAETDTSGAKLRELLLAAGHVVAAHELIKDDAAICRDVLNRWLADDGIDAILTNGGTGISRRDQTVPTIERMFDSPLPGFGELFRALSFKEIGPAAMMSRATAGVARGKFLAALPGSTAAVQLAMHELILPQIRHIVAELRK